MEIQQNFFEKNIKEVKSCILTGHRKLREDFNEKLVQTALKNAIEKGVEIFYNGMAKGFDLLCGKLLINFKKKYPNIQIIACIPCYNQEKNYTEEEKKLYLEILSKCNEKIILSNHYFIGCMQNRDRYMADRSDMMIAYLKKAEGGTAYTVKYFQKKYPEKEIVFL